MTKLWYEKYRPSSLDDYIWTNPETRTKVERWLQNPAELPHLILGGPAGTGKTTLGRLIRKELELEESDFLYLNASTENGADTIRNLIMDFCSMAGWSGVRVVMFDEAERLTPAAQEMLRGVINDYGDYVRFFFTCNEPRRIIEPLHSRCRLITIEALDKDSFTDRLVAICDQEEISLEDDASVAVLEEIIESHYPDMRKAIDMLQDCALDGRLMVATEKAKEVAHWEQSVRDIMAKKSMVRNMREIANAISPNDMPDVYKFLCENSGTFFKPEVEADAILVIADHEYRHNFSSFREINLVACLIKLSEIAHA